MPNVLTGWAALGVHEEKDFSWNWTGLLDGDTIVAAGTFHDGSPLVNGTVSAGATTMAIDGGAGSETIVDNELFRVAGVGGLYRFTAAYTASSGEIASAAFHPEAPASGFPDDAVITMDTSLWGMTQAAINAGLEITSETLATSTSTVWLQVLAGTDPTTIVGLSPLFVLGGIATAGGRSLRRKFQIDIESS